MIGTEYTPDLLAELAKTPHLRSMEIPTTPDGWACKTTLFDVYGGGLRRRRFAVRFHAWPRSVEGRSVHIAEGVERVLRH